MNNFATYFAFERCFLASSISSLLPSYESSSTSWVEFWNVAICPAKNNEFGFPYHHR